MLSPIAGRLLSKFRWIALLSFPIACFPLASSPGNVTSVLLSALVSFLCCGFLMQRLTSLSAKNATVWLSLGVFLLVYYLRYPMLVVDASHVIATHPDSISAHFRENVAGLDQAFVLSSIVFSIFCCVAALLLGRNTAAEVESDRYQKDDAFADRRIARALLVVIPVLMLVLGAFAYRYKIGQMGVLPGEPLPFRLKGVIFYGRLVVLPVLILTLIYLATRTQEKLLSWIGILLLATHAFSDMMLRGSRSSLLLCILLAVFLFANGGMRVRRTGAMITAAITISAIWLMPIIMQYRILRFTANDSLFKLLQQAVASEKEGAWTSLINSLVALYFRIPGIETIWAILNVKAEPLGAALVATMTTPFGLTGYLNFGLYHVLPEARTLYAPGFVGWLYLAGGYAGLVLGACFLAWICVELPRFIYDRNIRCAPVANTVVMWVLFLSLTDGTIDSNLLLVTIAVLSVGVLEFILRNARVRERAVFG